MKTSFIPVDPTSDFSIDNLPLGIFSPNTYSTPRAGTIVGETVVDLSVLESADLFSDIPDLSRNLFNQATLNALVEHDRHVWKALRSRLTDLLTSDGANDTLRTNKDLQKAAFHPFSSVKMYLPVKVGDYTDFYSSREHATNVGIMFRGKDNALQPNWLHLPVGYHGRSSTLYISGQDIRRPNGQLQKDKDDQKQGSIYGPCKLLDFELEVAAVVGGKANAAGQPLTIDQAKDRIFGFMLMNDWSARDIQKWEYVPLGPFTAKNFGTTVSPWIIMTEALQEFIAPTSAGTQDNPVPLEYLKDPNYSSYDIQLSVGIQSERQLTPTTICKSNFRNLYWNPAQQLAHHSITGCIMEAGDLLGSGTISGGDDTAFGSMLELSWKGSKEIKVGDEIRKFLKDGDTVVMNGFCQKDGHGRVGFGDCSGKILPALKEGESVPLPPSAIPLTGKDRFKNFVLYGYWRSSSSWRVRCALAAKGIKYKTIPINLLKAEHKAPEFLKINPLGQVPLLEYTDVAKGNHVVRMTQSVAMLEFLDAAFPKTVSMIPTDPVDRSIAYEMLELINSGTQPMQNIMVLKDYEKRSNGMIKAVEEANAFNSKGLQVLENMVKSRQATTLGPYCMGSFSPTIVDAVMVPQVFNARRYSVDVNTICPTLVKIDALCAEHPWFKASHPDAQLDAVKE